MDYLKSVREELNSLKDLEKSKNLERFFKTKKGEYGYGDKFIGLSVPAQRKIAKKFYKDIPIDDVVGLLDSEIHEHRLTALLMLVYKYEKSSDEEEKNNIINT